MPLRINLGVSEKRGLPEYGSIGASCGVEFEAEASLLQTDPEAFHRHVRNAYSACRQAVQDELARHRQVQESPASQPQAATQPTPGPVSQPANSDGNQNSGCGNGHSVSEKQLIYIQRLARQIEGLGVGRLDTIAQKMFDKPTAALSSMDASGMIDTLKAIKAGEIGLDGVLSGAET